MKVKFYALLRQITKNKETTEFSGESVLALLEKLCQTYGVRMSDWVFVPTVVGRKKELSNNVIILVNGRVIEHLAGLDSLLKDDDEVAIIPRLAG